MLKKANSLAVAAGQNSQALRPTAPHTAKALSNPANGSARRCSLYAGTGDALPAYLLLSDDTGLRVALWRSVSKPASNLYHVGRINPAVHIDVGVRVAGRALAPDVSGSAQVL